MASLVRAELVHGNEAKVSCWNGVDALGRDEIGWEDMSGEDT